MSSSRSTVMNKSRFQSIKYLFADYCEQKEQTTNLKWIDTVTFDEDSDQMFKEMKAVKIEACDPPLPLLYFYNKNTSTQVPTTLTHILFV